jgi:exosortase family protein XrtF
MRVTAYFNKWNTIPESIKKFILRALGILFSWKIVYLLFLLPTRVLDKPLSFAVAKGSALLLNFCSKTTAYTVKNENGQGSIGYGTGIVEMPLSNIYFYRQVVLSIEDGCNGLELLVLYAGFIVCLPATLRRKLLFIGIGMILIFLVNVLRCAGLVYLVIYYPKYVDVSHHYIFTFLVYGFIMGLWLLFSEGLKVEHARG